MLTPGTSLASKPRIYASQMLRTSTDLMFNHSRHLVWCFVWSIHIASYLALNTHTFTVHSHVACKYRRLLLLSSNYVDIKSTWCLLNSWRQTTLNLLASSMLAYSSDWLTNYILNQKVKAIRPHKSKAQNVTKMNICYGVQIWRFGVVTMSEFRVKGQGHIASYT